MKGVSRPGGAIAALALLAIAAHGQSRVAAAPVAPVQAAAAPAPPAVPASDLRSTYILGPDDLISVHVLDAEEISDKPTRIDLNGDIRMPMMPRMRAAGLTTEGLEAQIAGRLKEWIKQPDVTVSVVEFHSQPVSVLGAVKTPGVVQLQGRKTFAEVLALAGGLADDAGPVAKIARRLEWGPIPLPNAANDSSGQYSVAEASLRRILDAESPAEDIVIYPQDVISVPRAKMVYVLGQVPKAGAFILGGRDGLSVLQALALAGGTDRGASPKRARILRAAPAGGSLIEFPVDLTKVMTSQAADVTLQPEDILYVPASGGKKFFARAAEVAAQASTLLIYRIP